MKFCSQCAAPVVVEIPAGDNRERSVCKSCDLVHYENPKNVVGCLLTWEGKVLLCKRAIEPRYGYWTLPAGFMENQETTQDGAAREAYEEAHASVDNLRLFAVYNLPRISQVYLMYKGQLRDGFCEAGEESLEAGLFSEADIPWDELAFPVVTETLTRYFEAPDAIRQVLHADILSRPGGELDIVRMG
ncbi:MAG: NUDIX hydrolase [Granulosicoccus sp.]|nr:NUDIX hydrolase [Granulosicoccus sp.]